jgi:hypothetical protein
MTNTHALKILIQFNKWRRGVDEYGNEIVDAMDYPKLIGQAIDVAIKALESAK